MHEDDLKPKGKLVGMVYVYKEYMDRTLMEFISQLLYFNRLWPKLWSDILLGVY